MFAFLSFEGTPGCGKTTQIKKISRELKKRGYPVLVKDWGVQKYEYEEYYALLDRFAFSLKKKITDCLKIRRRQYFDLKLPYVESFLVLARLAVDWEKIVRPIMMKEENLILLADRDIDTFYAHQLVTFQKIYPNLSKHIVIGQMRNIALTWLKEPNLTIYIRVPAEVAIDRLKKRDKMVLHPLDEKFFRESIVMYDFLANIFQERYVIVDGTENANKVYKNMLRIILNYLAHV